MDVSPAAASAGLAGIGLAGGVLVRWVWSIRQDVKEAFLGQKRECAAEVAGLRGTIKVLFDKRDEMNQDLQAYKLHAAETYVNRAALVELLAPINARLERIEEDLRGVPR